MDHSYDRHIDFLNKLCRTCGDRSFKTGNKSARHFKCDRFRDDLVLYYRLDTSVDVPEKHSSTLCLKCAQRIYHLRKHNLIIGRANMHMDEMSVEGICESPSSTKEHMSKALIQIKTADEQEMQRRIDSFIRNKRNEVDERNIREFISPFGSDPNSSCARVEAIYVHREGMKSHINLKNVENSYGPQTRLRPDNQDGRESWMMPADVQRAEAVDERLLNMEHHLNISGDEGDIFKRIKALEERISFLEGLSPEYFTHGIPPGKNRKPKDTEREDYKPMDVLEGKELTDINKRIEQLKEILKSKS